MSDKLQPVDLAGQTKACLRFWRWWLPPAALSLILTLALVDPFIGDWDAFEYTLSALRGTPSSMALGRSLFIFYNHALCLRMARRPQNLTVGRGVVTDFSNLRQLGFWILVSCRSELSRGLVRLAR